MATTTENGYRAPEVVKLVGVTYRQLDYWARTDLIRPSLADAKGSGSRRRYSAKDLVELKMIKTLLDSGQKLERVRAAFEYLRDLGDDLSAVQLVIAGESVIFVRDDELIDVVNKHRGQGVLNFLALDGVVEQVDAGIHDLRPLDGDLGLDEAATAAR